MKKENFQEIRIHVMIFRLVIVIHRVKGMAFERAQTIRVTSYRHDVLAKSTSSNRRIFFDFFFFS